MAVMLGALLMAIGHLVLGASEIAPTFPICRSPSSSAVTDCFKSNVSCLLGELYEPTDPRRDGGFADVCGGEYRFNRRPIACCGYVQEEYSWAMGFALAAVGMIAGLVIFPAAPFRHTSASIAGALRAPL